MFEKRTNLVRFLAVAETGRIGAAAERTNVTQPTLTLLSRAGRSLTGRSCQWLPVGVGRRMSRDSHRVALLSPTLRPGAPGTPEGFADCNAVRSAPQPGPACGTYRF